MGLDLSTHKVDRAKAGGGFQEGAPGDSWTDHRLGSMSEFLHCMWKGNCEVVHVYSNDSSAGDFERPRDFEAVRSAIKASTDETMNDWAKEHWLQYLDYLEANPDYFVYMSC